MPDDITMWELVPSRRHRGSVRDPAVNGVDLHFMLKESFDDEAVRAYLLENKPDTHLGLYFEDYDLNPIGGGIWEAVCHYGTAGAALVEQNRTAFEIGATTQHIIRSNRHVSSHGNNPPDFKGLIGVNEDNTVEGTDVYVPEFSFSETKVFDDADVDNVFVLDLRSLAFKVNAEPFRGHAAGEVLFMGVSAAPKDAGQWDFTFRFKARENESLDLELTSDGIAAVHTVPKRGWEILWVFNTLKADDNNVLVPRPAWAYVEEFYREGDFDKLRLD